MAGFLDETGLTHLVNKISTTFVPNNKIHERLGLSGTSDNPILLYELKSGDYIITKDSYVKVTPTSTASAVTSTDITLTLQRNYYGNLYTQSYIVEGYFNLLYTSEYKFTPSDSLNKHRIDLTKGSDPCITTETYLKSFKLNGTTVDTASIYAPTKSGTANQILASSGEGLAPKWINFPEHFSGDYNDLSNKPNLFSGDYNDLSNKPTLFSGSYNDLTGKPELFSGKYEDLSGKPTIPDLDTLATVAHTGNYDDLINKPTIPSIDGLATEAFVNQKIAVLTENNTDAMDSLKELANALNNDKNFASTMATELGKKANKETTLAGYGITDAKISNGTITLGSNSIKPLTSFTETDPTVPAWAKAENKPTYTWTEITDKPSFFSGNYNDLIDKPTLFSGNYTDLTNKPTIPTVNNAKLTIQKNGTTVETFTANASKDITANITVPTGAAADKGVDTSIAKGSTSTNLPTSKAVAAFVEGKGYLTSNAVTSVNGQTGAVTITIPSGAAASYGVTTTITGSNNLPTDKAVKTFVEGKGYVTSSGTVAKATTADSATKATQDGNGKTIASTYATKTELNALSASIPSTPTLTTGTTNGTIKYNGTEVSVAGLKANAFTDTAIPTQFVSTLNNLTGAVTLKAGANISLATSGNTVTINNTSSGASITQIWSGSTRMGANLSGNAFPNASQYKFLVICTDAGTYTASPVYYGGTSSDYTYSYPYGWYIHGVSNMGQVTFQVLYTDEYEHDGDDWTIPSNRWVCNYKKVLYHKTSSSYHQDVSSSYTTYMPLITKIYGIK